MKIVKKITWLKKISVFTMTDKGRVNLIDQTHHYDPG